MMSVTVIVDTATRTVLVIDPPRDAYGVEILPNGVDCFATEISDDQAAVMGWPPFDVVLVGPLAPDAPTPEKTASAGQFTLNADGVTVDDGAVTPPALTMKSRKGTQ